MPAPDALVRGWSRLQPTPRGVLWMVFACVAFACMGVVARYLTRFLPPEELVFFRNALALAWMLPWLARVGLVGLRTSNFRM
jgi:drug/metabolite transporter (DMT)-like permease